MRSSDFSSNRWLSLAAVHIGAKMLTGHDSQAIKSFDRIGLPAASTEVLSHHRESTVHPLGANRYRSACWMDGARCKSLEG